MSSNNKGINWDDVPLGSKPDTVIAKEFGVVSQVVAKARSRRGIPRFSSTGYRTLTDEEWQSCGLGEKPDSEIARELGVSRESVGLVRRNRGIPAFTGLVLLQDGTPCRSVYEAMYDAVLHHLEKRHEHEVEFKDLGVVADLVVEGTVTEIAGMVGYPPYDKRRAKKEEIYSNAGISVTWLTPEYVLECYQSVPLDIKTRTRYCVDCETQTIDLVRGRCRPCRIKSWRVETAITDICESCGESYQRSSHDTKRKFCGRQCYWKSLELGWPPQEEIDALLSKVGNVSEVARRLGVKSATLHMKLWRQASRTTQ